MTTPAFPLQPLCENLSSFSRWNACFFPSDGPRWISRGPDLLLQATTYHHSSSRGARSYPISNDHLTTNDRTECEVQDQKKKKSNEKEPEEERKFLT